MNPRVKTTDYLRQQQAPSTDPIPTESDWEDLALLLAQVTQVQTTKRHTLVLQIIKQTTFQYFLRYYVDLSTARVLSIYNLIIESRSTNLIQELTNRAHLISFLADLLQPDLAEKYLYDLLQLMTNAKISLNAHQLCIQFIENWSQTPTFDGQEVYNKLLTKINTSHLSPSGATVYLAQLQKLGLQKLPLKRKEAPSPTIISETNSTIPLIYYDGFFKKLESKNAMFLFDGIKEEELEPCHEKAKFELT